MSVEGIVALDQGRAGDLLPALGHRLLHRHAAADSGFHAAEVELGELRIVEQCVEQRVDAADHRVLVPREFLHEARDVARIGDQHVLAADHHHHQAVHREREDMVERQRGDDHRPPGHRRLQPGRVLQQRRDDIAVREDGALRDTGGAAGVLQESDVGMT
jgi:hypothetical protein